MCFLFVLIRRSSLKLLFRCIGLVRVLAYGISITFLKQHLISQKHCYIAKLHRIWLWGISHFSVMRKIIFNAIKNFSNITRFAKSTHSFIFVFERFCAKKQGPKIDWLNHELEICFIKKYIFLNLVKRENIR